MAILKIKTLLGKVTSKVIGFEEKGMAAELQGKNSVGTGNCSLTTSYKNPLAGQSKAILYGADGTASSATTTTQQNDLFVVTPSTGKIKLLKAGHYFVIASAYAYSGFTAEDQFLLRVQKNDTNYGNFYANERMSGTYQIIFLCRSYSFAANDELNIAVCNNTAARGIVVSSLATTLQVIKVA